MRKSTILASLAASSAALAFSAMSVGQTVYYNGTGGNSNLDVSYSIVGSNGTTDSTGYLSLGSASYTSTGGGSASAADNRYYGGTVSFVQGGSPAAWTGPNMSIQLYTDENQPVAGGGTIGFQLQAQNSYWGASQVGGELTGPGGSYSSGATASATAMSLPGSLTSFDFVLEVQELPWGQASLSFYLGANADALTQPATPDYTTGAINILEPNGTPSIDQMLISLASNDNGSTSSLTTSNMFGSSVWTPVQSATAVPEPTGMSLLLLAGLPVLAKRQVRYGSTTA